MKRYLLIAFALHSLLFINLNRTKVMGFPDGAVKINVPISYNVIGAEPRIDGMQKVQGSVETQPEPEPEPEEVEQKIEKPEEPEFESKMSNNKEKKEPEKKQEPKKQPVKKNNNNNKKTEKTDKPSNANPDDVFTKSGNFTSNSDGTYTAISSKGINFDIISQPDPAYPRQAEVIRYSQTVTVEVRFLVGLDGNIEEVKIVKSHEKFGFDKEVLAALKKWKFKPIVYNGRKIKVYFNKEFVFTPKS